MKHERQGAQKKASGAEGQQPGPAPRFPSSSLTDRRADQPHAAADFPTLTPEEAANLVVDAIIHKQVRIATRLGIFGALIHSLMPKVAQIIMNTSFRMFPDSVAAAHKDADTQKPSADQIAFAQIMRGMYF